MHRVRKGVEKNCSHSRENIGKALHRKGVQLVAVPVASQAEPVATTRALPTGLFCWSWPLRCPILPSNPPQTRSPSLPWLAAWLWTTRRGGSTRPLTSGRLWRRAINLRCPLQRPERCVCAWHARDRRFRGRGHAHTRPPCVCDALRGTAGSRSRVRCLRSMCVHVAELCVRYAHRRTVLAISFEYGHNPGGTGYLEFELQTDTCSLWQPDAAESDAGAPSVRCALMFLSFQSNDMARPVAEVRCAVELEYDLGCSGTTKPHMIHVVNAKFRYLSIQKARYAEPTHVFTTLFASCSGGNRFH